MPPESGKGFLGVKEDGIEAGVGVCRFGDSSLEICKSVRSIATFAETVLCRG